MIRCAKCNASNDDEALYCGLCGSRLQKPVPPDAIPPVTHDQYPSGTGMPAVQVPAPKYPLLNSSNSPNAQQGAGSQKPQINASTGAKHGFKWSVLGTGLAIVLIVALVSFGAARSFSSSSASSGNRQSSAVSVNDAREELKSTLADLKKGIDEANDVVADASDEDAKTLRDGIDKAQKLYDSTTSEMSGVDSADKLSTLSNQVYQENTSLSDSVSAYKTAVKERMTSMTYVLTNDAGYQYQVSIKNLGVSVEKNTSEGAPGTVELSYNTTATATITNITKDKTAPLICWDKDASWNGNMYSPCSHESDVHYGKLVPLYSKNMCSAVSAIGARNYSDLCARYSIDGKEYWSWVRDFNLFPSEQLEEGIYHEWQKRIKSEESIEGWWGQSGRLQDSSSEPTTATVNEEDSDALLEALRQPVGWVVVLRNQADRYSNSFVYNGTGSLGTIQMTTSKLWYDTMWGEMRTDGKEEELSYYLMARTPGI